MRATSTIIFAVAWVAGFLQDGCTVVRDDRSTTSVDQLLVHSHGPKSGADSFSNELSDSDVDPERLLLLLLHVGGLTMSSERPFG